MTQRDKSRIYGIIGSGMIVAGVILGSSAKATEASFPLIVLASILFVKGCALRGNAQQARRIAALKERIRKLETCQAANPTARVVLLPLLSYCPC